MKVYRTQDVSLEPLKNKRFAILGYGIQGQAQAHNLRDAGFDVIIGGRPGKSLEKAGVDGFPTYSYPQAAEKADFIFLLVPDAVHADVFSQISAFVSGKTLVLAHGSSIHFGWIKPPADCDVILVAPHGSGRQVRESFLANTGTVAAFAVHHDHSGNAKAKALGLCKALRFTQAGVYECRIKDEAISDVFGEQAVLCGGAAELIRQAFQALLDKGYSKEAAYFGTLYELRSMMALYVAEGIDGMLERVSEAARFGGLKNGKRIVDSNVNENMKRLLEEIESGAFFNEFLKESKEGFPRTRQWIEEEKTADINQTGRWIRREFRL